jgi:methylmalonyl-CoA mutase
MRLARAQFSSSFFGCAGYRVIDNGGYGSVAEGMKAANDSGAEIIVLCSSDDEYVTLAPEAFALKRDKVHFVVAGAPECMDELKKIGIEHFISIRSDVLATLKQFHSLIGITI